MMRLKRWGMWLYLILVVAHLTAPLVSAANGNNKDILVIDVEGPVTPIMLSFIDRAIEEAELQEVEALIIRLDTPGGSVNLTQEIIQTVIIADVPVVIYVWPPGGMAASAGTFITLAGHVAAMAPNTTIGAASPVQGSGEDINETLKSKVENILTAEIRHLTERRGEKAVQWAEETITEAKAANASEALDIGVIDFVADDIDDLLEQMDGFIVTVNSEDITLETAEAEINFLEATTIENILTVITNPSIALLLISFGGLAVMYELIYPGGYMGGIIGVLLLLVGFYAMGQLPVNYAGLGLILLAFALFAAELFTPTFGALTSVGAISFVIGALILFNTDEISYQLPLYIVIGLPIFLALAIGFGLGKVLQTQKQKPATGQEGLIGAVGTVKSELNPQGTIIVWGERWQALSHDATLIPQGSRVEVIEVNGFQLKVTPFDRI